MEQRVGPYNILLVEETGKDKYGHKKGKFLCPYEHEDGLPHYFETTITSVRSGRTKSCGCLKTNRKKTLEEKVLKDDVIDKTFNRLTVIKPLYVDDHGSVVYLCKCSCSDNAYKETTATKLRNNLVKSCGCLAKERSKKTVKIMIEKNKKDLKNQTIGTWTALYPTDKKNSSGNIYWICRCENGHYHLIDTGNWGKIKTCRQCKNESSSLGESIIQNLLDQMNIKYEKEKVFDDCIYKRKLRFDFYLTDLNTCIEYDGIQHFKPTTFSHDNFTERKKRDKIKNKYCKEKGIKLVRIPYTDIDLLDKEYLKGKLDETAVV